MKPGKICYVIWLCSYVINLSDSSDFCLLGISANTFWEPLIVRELSMDITYTEFDSMGLWEFLENRNLLVFEGKAI